MHKLYGLSFFFTKKSYETAETNGFGLFFMNFHEKYCTKRLFHEIHEKIVRNWPFRPFFMNFHEKYRTKRPNRTVSASFPWNSWKNRAKLAVPAFFHEFSWKISYETAETNGSGLFFMNFHEKIVRIGRSSLFSWIFMKNIVRIGYSGLFSWIFIKKSFRFVLFIF